MATMLDELAVTLKRIRDEVASVDGGEGSEFPVDALTNVEDMATEALEHVERMKGLMS